MANVLRYAFLGDSKGLVAAAKESSHAIHETEQQASKSSSGMTKAANVATAALAGGALAIAAIAVKNGDALNESQDQLDNALRNAHEHVKNLGSVLAPLDSRMEHYGFTNEQVNESLTSFTRSGIKLTSAIHDEQLAADLAAAKHISLADATMLVTKASEGQLRPLKQMGIDLPLAAGGAAKLVAAEQKLERRTRRLAQRSSTWRT
jgi:hypothetical protein